MDTRRFSLQHPWLPVPAAIFLLAVAVVSSCPLQAADGDPDPAFGSGGVIEIAWDDGGDNKDVAKGIAADHDGNLFAVGFGASATGDKDWQIARIDAAGGILRQRKFFDRGGTDDDLAEALVLDGNGGLVVAGIAADAGTNHLEICRFSTTTLAYDPAFGTAFGCEEVDYGAGQIVNVVALERAGDGGFIVGGTLNQSGDDNFFATRFTSTGHVDPNFGFFGLRVIPWNIAGTGYDVLHAMAVDVNGEILLAGEAEGGTIYTISVLAKLTAAGHLDLGFGSGGKVVMPSSSAQPSRWVTAAAPDLHAGTTFGIAEYLGDTVGGAVGYTHMVDGAGTVGPAGSFLWWDLAAQNFPVRILFQSDGSPLVLGYHPSVAGAFFDASRCASLEGCSSYDFKKSFSPSAAGWGDGIEVASAALSGGRPVLAGTIRRPVNNTNWLLVRLDNRLIFRDGFETGDDRAWPAY
ncbi:MAG: hypothetical protein ABI689_09245 [Thermoanaerobaculia bacterium]